MKLGIGGSYQISGWKRSRVVENEVNGIQAGKKNVPPEAAAASPIHRNYQPAGQLHIMRLTAEEQPKAPDFFPVVTAGCLEI